MTDTSRDTLMVIDGHSLAFRAFYALPPESFQLESGLHTNAIHGFLGMLLNLLDKERPTRIAVAFDLSRHSFRTEEYPEYKGTRGETPEEFKGQVEHLQQVLEAMNITVITKENFEADDILATLSLVAEQAGERVLVVSGDRDTFQLVDENVTLLYPVKGVSQLSRFTPDAVHEKYGVPPEHYPDIAALVGETSDNLPGVPGVGPKTAAKWINKYGDVYDIIASADAIKGKVGESLRAHIDDVERNRRLNRLRRDLELPVTLDDLRVRGVDHERVEQVFTELELRTMKARVQGLDGQLHKVKQRAVPVSGIDAGPNGAGANASAPAQATTASSFGQTHNGGLPVPVITAEPPVATKAASVTALLAWAASLGADATVGLAFEIADGGPIAMALATADESRVAALPDGSDTTTRESLHQWLAGEHPKAVHGLKQMLHELDRAGITAPRDAAERSVGEAVGGIVLDSELAWYLFDSTRSDYSLRASEDLFFTSQFEHEVADDALFDVAGEADEEASSNADGSAGPSGADRDTALAAWQTLVLGRELVRSLDTTRGGQVLRDIELPLSPVLAKMEATGIAVDVDGLEQLGDSFADKARDIASEAYKVIGHETNLASPKQLQQVLFDELGMPKTRKTKTGYSTNQAALTALYEQTQHPFLELLAAHRDATKLAQMVVSLRRTVADDGRIHTTYQQTGTATGRLSSTDPNLQNIPVRTEEGRRIRDQFVSAPEYETLISADYSQIEMRIMAHVSRDEGLIEAFNSGEDLHRYVGSKVFGVTPDEVTPEMRSKVKAMSYGLVYGLSAFGLANQLRITRDEAKDLMSGYFRRFGGVRDYLRNVVEQARVDGYTETIYGRRRPFGDLHSRDRRVRDNAERAALNAPIQGSAADIIKLAMLAVDRRLATQGLRSRLLLQVHDELILEVADGELEAVRDLVTDAMGNAASLDVPLDVHIGTGTSWNKAAH
ncbi:DNA polymerase I [Pseudoclavibacter sp. CFCC 13796]|uniref:DNA polymerase I n=1 Tax=Pseudoclavibacter sp. CFCC 13796 TaxID=2615179 RepID=UPI001300DDCD|nr:DNA polymerase I [Pseudoclavibacter sp. CFCC 13796]